MRYLHFRSPESTDVYTFIHIKMYHAVYLPIKVTAFSVVGQFRTACWKRPNMDNLSCWTCFSISKNQ